MFAITAEQKKGLGIRLFSDVNRSKVNLATLTHCVLLLAIVSFGAYYRFINIPRSISGAPAIDLTNSFSGIRLYLLPWWNLADSLRQNFFKSLLYTGHGLGDTLFYYPVVLLYSALDIPLTEWNLFAAKAFLSTVTLVLVYCLASRLFNAWVGLLCAAILAFSPTDIAFSSLGWQLTFVIFLQVISVLAYFWYLSRRIWWTALPAAALLGIQAGSENFYYIAVLLVLHFCHVHEEKRSFRENVASFRYSFLSWRNLLVWSPYAFMWVVNIAAYRRVGYQQDMTLLGHILWNTSLFSRSSGLSLGRPLIQMYLVDQVFNMVRKTYPIFSAAYFAALVLNFNHARRFTMRGFVWWWSIIVTALIVLSGRWNPFNAAHLLIPASVLIAVTVSDGLQRVGRRLRPKGQVWETAATGLVVITLMLVLAPGAMTAKLSPKWGLHYASDVFRGMKAAGAVVRTLGNPKMNVFVLTTDDVPLSPLEYYFGLSHSNSDYEPNQLFFHNERYAPQGGILDPETLAAAYRFKEFDFYVEFVREPPYPQKAAVLDRLKARGVHLVAAIYDGPEAHEPDVRIYSPHVIPFRRYLIHEQEDLFDRHYAKAENLFYNVNVWTGYYYGYHWHTTKRGEIKR